MKKLSLICTDCNKSFPIDRISPRCDVCDEPLEVNIIKLSDSDYENIYEKNIFKRFSAFFPYFKDSNDLLFEGNTPLVKYSDNVFLKNETVNPTWSFKDRGTMCCIKHALSIGYKHIGTVSTGNMAASVAAYGAAQGLKTTVLVSSNIPEEKLNPISVYGTDIYKVKGNYGDLYFESLRLAEKKKIYFMNSDVPFRVEGSKTIAFELFSEMGKELPDFVIVPVSAGGNIRGILKGFIELNENGFTDKIPTIVCAQAKGCSPIVDAYERGDEKITKLEDFSTLAHAIENPYPPSGNQVLRILRKHNGIFVSVDEESILKAQKNMAQKGVFTQPAGAVPLAALEKLKSENKISENAQVVCIVTGSGLKHQSALNVDNNSIKEISINRLSDEIK